MSFNTTGGGSYAITGASTDTLTLATAGTASVTLSVSGGAHSIAVPIALDNNLAVTTQTATSQLTISGPISENNPGMSLTLGGSGTLVLTGTNTYTGSTTVANAATLKVKSPSSLPGYDSGFVAVGNTTTSTAKLVLSAGGAGTGEWNSTGTDDIGSLLNATAFSASATLGIDTTDATTALTLSDDLSTFGKLLKLGAHTLILSGTNTYTGGTTVSGGTLDFAGPSATPSVGILTVNKGGYVVLGKLIGARRLPSPTAARRMPRRAFFPAMRLGCKPRPRLPKTPVRRRRRLATLPHCRKAMRAAPPACSRGTRTEHAGSGADRGGHGSGVSEEAAHDQVVKP